jgi:hypothetical protein
MQTPLTIAVMVPGSVFEISKYVLLSDKVRVVRKRWKGSWNGRRKGSSQPTRTASLWDR